MPDLLTTVAIVLALVVVVVLGQTVVLLGVVRKVYESTPVQREQANPIQIAPDFVAADLTGKTFSSHSLAGQPRMFLFVSPTCRSCATTLDHTGPLKTKVGGNLIIVCQGSRNECATLVALHGLDVPVLLDPDRRISEMHLIGVVPTAIIVQGVREITSYGEPVLDNDQQFPTVSGASALD